MGILSTVFSVIMGIVSIIALIVFFRLASDIKETKEYVAKIQKYLKGYAMHNDIGIFYKCPDCDRTFEARRIGENICYHCKDKKKVST